jgi:DNA-binding NarL/FixJ family response regulator
MIKILIADDHNLMIDGIKTTLSDIADMQIVAGANNGLEVLKILEHTKVDVVLMDINMPLMDGLDCTKTISQQYPDIKVIALSQYNESRFIKRMVINGASGYLLKDAQKEELVKAIRTVFAGEQYYGRNLVSDPTRINNRRQSNYDNLPELSERELEILTLICSELSCPEIAEKINLSFSTVEKHRANLMMKSGSKNTAGLVRWALENNLVN